MYTITRQHQWPEGKYVVEVSYGGIDYCNPDALGAEYGGEFQEFSDPREAVETAIAICRNWRKDSRKKDFQPKHITLGIGSTGGNTMPFESISFRNAQEWAKKEWESLPKCDHCGEPLPEKNKQWRRADDWTGERFCSERCVERAVEFDAQFDEEENQ